MPFAAACLSCGTENQPGAKFCSECATPLASSGPHPARAGARGGQASPIIPDGGAERRLVSVLFADLVGFTPFAEERDAEDVRETLTRYFELATDVITRYGGTVEKFIGDAVMAIWGAPVAREDDAERAVRAGLELVDVVRSLGPELPMVPIQRTKCLAVAPVARRRNAQPGGRRAQSRPDLVGRLTRPSGQLLPY